MNDLLLEQGSPEWYAARAGSLGGSQISAALATAPGGYGRGTTSKDLIISIALERLTGKTVEREFYSRHVNAGKEREEKARELYSFLTDNEVTQVGLVRHPRISGTHSSPDGLVGTDGVIEIKCPKQRTHFETITKRESIKRAYALQTQWHMACTGRIWCDFVSYNPDFPGKCALFIHRVERNDDLIEAIEDGVRDFLFEVDYVVRRLKREFDL